MALRPAALLSVGFLLLLTPGGLSNKGPASIPIRVSVETSTTTESYLSSVVEGGVLLGALRRLQETPTNFKFTTKENPDFGPFVVSINGIAGNKQDHTYWEILSECSGEHKRLEVGVGCYIPAANEHIVFRLSTWSSEQ
ncbi:transcobalamin-1-like [Embiotoca jacksoni]|uniref:transcobalamin-1-like n=1 Tax=Embiotoca jacksoni TaxID=100190 RepID=UPI003703A4BA